jgi:hypothetical protein
VGRWSSGAGAASGLKVEKVCLGSLREDVGVTSVGLRVSAVFIRVVAMAEMSTLLRCSHSTSCLASFNTLQEFFIVPCLLIGMQQSITATAGKVCRHAKEFHARQPVNSTAGGFEHFSSPSLTATMSPTSTLPFIAHEVPRLVANRSYKTAQRMIISDSITPYRCLERLPCYHSNLKWTINKMYNSTSQDDLPCSRSCELCSSGTQQFS